MYDYGDTVQMAGLMTCFLTDTLDNVSCTHVNDDGPFNRRLLEELVSICGRRKYLLHCHNVSPHSFQHAYSIAQTTVVMMRVLGATLVFLLSLHCYTCNGFSLALPRKTEKRAGEDMIIALTHHASGAYHVTGSTH